MEPLTGEGSGVNRVSPGGSGLGGLGRLAPCDVRPAEPGCPRRARLALTALLTSPRHAYLVAEQPVTDHHSRNTWSADPAKLAGPPPSRVSGSRGLPPGQYRGHGPPPTQSPQAPEKI